VKVTPMIAGIVTSLAAKVFMPFLLDQFPPRPDNPRNDAQLMRVQTTAPRQLARRHPKLRLTPMPLHMDMAWFVPFVAVKQETVAPLAKNRRHAKIISNISAAGYGII
jgi:hypothetical protein